MGTFKVGDKVTLTGLGLKSWLVHPGNAYAPETWGVGTVHHLYSDERTVLVDFPGGNPFAQAIPAKFGFHTDMNMYTDEITKDGVQQS